MLSSVMFLGIYHFTIKTLKGINIWVKLNVSMGCKIIIIHFDFVRNAPFYMTKKLKLPNFTPFVEIKIKNVIIIFSLSKHRSRETNILGVKV